MGHPLRSSVPGDRLTVPADGLAATLGHAFARPDLLVEALTHPSALLGRKLRRVTPYERLEFLGDRVLGLAVAEMLYLRYPDEAEGALARRHAALVRREALARVARSTGIAAAIVMAKGEEDTGGRANPGLLADACEAVIGALYCDGGLDVAARFVRSQWEALMEEAEGPPKDAKTELQEWAQGRGKPLPAYRTVGVEGPQHDPVFEVAVEVAGLDPVSGRGSSKRAAEQAAATAMLEKAKMV
ncbi:MAG: ribonuclease III [Magnetospirillum sp.]|nr:ribonuclease III [Magnetospirillum sp.]